jgi:hypothetical protein
LGGGFVFKNLLTASSGAKLLGRPAGLGLKCKVQNAECKMLKAK